MDYVEVNTSNEIGFTPDIVLGLTRITPGEFGHLLVLFFRSFF